MSGWSANGKFIRAATARGVSQVAKHPHYTLNAPSREAGASCLKASGTKTAHPPLGRV